jgi:hypothetical protein
VKKCEGIDSHIGRLTPSEIAGGRSRNQRALRFNEHLTEHTRTRKSSTRLVASLRVERERPARVGEMTERTLSGARESMHDDRHQRDVQLHVESFLTQALFRAQSLQARSPSSTRLHDNQ